MSAKSHPSLWDDSQQQLNRFFKHMMSRGGSAFFSTCLAWLARGHLIKPICIKCTGAHFTSAKASSCVCMTHNAIAACSIWRHPCKDEDGAQSQQKWCLRQREEGSSRLRRAEEERAAAVICLTSHMGICRDQRQDGRVASKSLFLKSLGFACICPEYDWTLAMCCRLLHMGSSTGCCSVYQPLCLFAATHAQLMMGLV